MSNLVNTVPIFHISVATSLLGTVFFGAAMEWEVKKLKPYQSEFVDKHQQIFSTPYITSDLLEPLSQDDITLLDTYVSLMRIVVPKTGIRTFIEQNPARVRLRDLASYLLIGDLMKYFKYEFYTAGDRTRYMTDGETLYPIALDSSHIRNYFLEKNMRPETVLTLPKECTPDILSTVSDFLHKGQKCKEALIDKWISHGYPKKWRSSTQQETRKRNYYLRRLTKSANAYDYNRLGTIASELKLDTLAKAFAVGLIVHTARQLFAQECGQFTEPDLSPKMRTLSEYFLKHNKKIRRFIIKQKKAQQIEGPISESSSSSASDEEPPQEHTPIAQGHKQQLDLKQRFAVFCVIEQTKLLKRIDKKKLLEDQSSPFHQLVYSLPATLISQCEAKVKQ